MPGLPQRADCGDWRHPAACLAQGLGKCRRAGGAEPGGGVLAGVCQQAARFAAGELGEDVDDLGLDVRLSDETIAQLARRGHQHRRLQAIEVRSLEQGNGAQIVRQELLAEGCLGIGRRAAQPPGIEAGEHGRTAGQLARVGIEPAEYADESRRPRSRTP